MAELFPAAAAVAAQAEQVAHAAAADVTARQPPLALVESGALPLHALAIAGAPTAPKQRLARGSGAALAQPVPTARVASGGLVDMYARQDRAHFDDDDDDAPTLGRRALRRRSSVRTFSKLAA
jgi:hypothetical protein